MDVQPNFHDGFLDGVVTSNSQVRIFLRTAAGDRFTLLLEGVELLTVDGFREGNIVLSVDFLEPAQFNPATAPECNLPLWIEKAREKQLSALEISPSYGGTLLATFRQHVFVQGYVLA